MESILTSIKKLLGPEEEYEEFDVDIIIHINSAFSTLHQLGVGPANAFKIQDASAVWEDFIPEDSENFEFVKTYIYLKVKKIFDPPLNASVLSAIEAEIKELEWRLNVEAESDD